MHLTATVNDALDHFDASHDAFVVFSCATAAALDALRAAVFARSFGERLVVVVTQDASPCHPYRTIRPGDVINRAFVPDVLIADAFPEVSVLRDLVVPLLANSTVRGIFMDLADNVPTVLRQNATPIA
jgi:hypothetical protein